MQYWDTSALLKLYVPEPDSAQFAAHVNVPSILTSELTRWELLRAVVRKEMDQAIPANSAEAVFARFLSDVSLGRIGMLASDTAVETRFRSLVLQLHRRQPPVVIWTMDALHLATADLLKATELVTTDTHLRAGAIAIGLKPYP